MLVTDRLVAGGTDALVGKVAAAVDGGADWVQVREKDLADEALVELAKRIVEVTAGRAQVVVNGPDTVAERAGAYGVHCPEGADVPTRMRWGRSVHSVEVAVAAEADGAEWLVLGPVFATETHPGGPPVGLRMLREVAGRVKVPVMGIGGIDATNAREVVAAGASGVAVIRAILAAGDARRAAMGLREALDA
jgi:thiamine-phosphate pyrophosphorylase